MANIRPDATTDFSRGTFEDVAATRYPSNAAAQILNGRIYPDGTVERRDGTMRLHTSALNAATGFGAVEFITAAGAKQLVAFFGDRAFVSTDGGVNWTDETPLEGGMNSMLREDYYDFAIWRVGATNYLFCANGDTELWRWNGTAFSATPNAPSGLKHIAVFNKRLWGTGHSGVLVQASRIADPETWASPDGLTVQVDTADGQPPTGLYQIGPHLLVFDRESTSYIDGYGEATLIVASDATGFSRSVGCVAFRTIVGVGDNEVCWLSLRGIEHYSPNSGISLLSRGLQTFLNNIDRVSLEQNPGRPSACYDGTDNAQEYHLALPTAGARNNRTIVLNLLLSGRGWQGAPTIDRHLSAIGEGEILFTSPDGDYLGTGAGGSEAIADSDGYMDLVTGGGGGDPTAEDADGYLETLTNDALPATLFMASCPDRGQAVHSLGYDGFVRKHFGVDNDDVLASGSGGNPVTMTMVSRPFMNRTALQRKRARIIHLAGIADNEVTVTALVRSQGTVGPERTKTIPATAFTQGRRVKLKTHAKGDAPQVEIRTSDKVRISLIGLGSELLREEVG